MKAFIFILLLFVPLLVKADEGRFRRAFTSSNDKYELRIKDRYLQMQKWSLVEKASEKSLYELTAELSSQTVLVSDDGKKLVAIDDYSESAPEDNPEVLRFYLDGKQVKSYKLSDLLENPKIITKTVSHFNWIFNLIDLSINGSKFNLTTFELFHYEFDINTGATLKKERDSRLSDGAIYAYGDISGSMNGEHKMKIRCLIYGKMPADKIIKFESKKYIYDVKSMRDTVIIKDGKLIEHLGIIMNRCAE